MEGRIRQLEEIVGEKERNMDDMGVELKKRKIEIG